ncbi:MAG: DNA repair protein RecO [Ruminococcus callidus]
MSAGEKEQFCGTFCDTAVFLCHLQRTETPESVVSGQCRTDPHLLPAAGIPLRLSLAMYFGELIRLSVREHQTPEENCFVMRLMLNTLHYLESGQRSEALLKPIFELRLMTELGMMPDLLMCRGCGVFLPKRLYFSVEKGCFFCTDCGAPDSPQEPLLLRAPVLQAMRHILFADYDRLFHFQLGAENLQMLGICTERFVQYHLSLKPKALTFYRSIVNPSAE